MNYYDLSKVYDEFYDKGVEILEKHGNPCQPNKWGTCPNPREHFCCGVINPTETVRPRKASHREGCLYLEKDKRKKKQGCTVKSLFCKLWLCGYIRNEYPKLAIEMGNLETEVREIFPEIERAYEKSYAIKWHLRNYHGRQNKKRKK